MTWWRLAFDVACGWWWLRTVAAVVGRPASRWRTRWVGKALCVAGAVLLVTVWWGLLVPWGAALVSWRVLLRGRDPFELPTADGRPMR